MIKLNQRLTLLTSLDTSLISISPPKIPVISDLTTFISKHFHSTKICQFLGTQKMISYKYKRAFVDLMIKNSTSLHGSLMKPQVFIKSA